MQGRYVIITKSGMAFGATSVEAREADFIIRLKGLEHRLGLHDIAVAYEVDPTHRAAQIDPGILSTVAALEMLMAEFGRVNPSHVTTIFGSCSLALTLLPDRSTNDLDAVASVEFQDFVNSKNAETDIAVEILGEDLLRLLGPWADRTSELRGPLGMRFRLVHPLDTIMQKLLRYREDHFVAKDQGDIEAILQALQPSKETLVNLLTENPARYARLPGRYASQINAVERNTRWFLNAHLPEMTYDNILEKTGDRAIESATTAGLLPQIPPVDFRTFLKRSPDILH